MATVSQEQLEKILTDYSGKLLDRGKLSTFQQTSMPFFADPKLVSDPRVQFTLQLDITSIFKNFEKNYKKSSDIATFTAFIKWILIKTMFNTPFYWRYINGEWYEFTNLPLEVSVATNDERQQLLYFLNDVISDSWETFYSKHHALIAGELPDALDQIKILPLYAFAIEIVGIPFPRMTSYSTTNKIENIHQPWIVLGARYQEGDALYLPLHISLPHASLTPKLAGSFLNKFNYYANLTPEEVQTSYRQPLGNTIGENGKLFNSQQLSFLPGFQSSRKQKKDVILGAKNDVTSQDEVKNKRKAKL